MEGGKVDGVVVLNLAKNATTLAFSDLLRQLGVPCKRLMRAQALVANCLYLSIQVVFVLRGMDHRVWLTMRAEDCAEVLRNTRNWFATLPGKRG